MARSDHRQAFTLVELLVVIGIIAVLVGILLPSLNKARKAAQLVVCESNLRQWGMGIQMYVNQNKGALPQKGPDGSDVSASGANYFGSPASGVIGFNDPSIWFNSIPPLINKKSYYDLLVDDYLDPNRTPAPKPGMSNIFMCPTASEVGIISVQDIPPSNGYLFLHGSDSTGVVRNSTGLAAAASFKFACPFVWNSKLTSRISNLGIPDVPTLKMSRCQPASEVILMVEKLVNAGEYQDKGVQTYFKAYPQAYTSVGVGAEITPLGYVNKLAQSKSNWKRFTTRHRGGGDLLFADGHVAWFSWPDVQIQPSQMPYNPNTSDANQPGKMIWSVAGSVN